jgi:hypothetical protein
MFVGAAQLGSCASSSISKKDYDQAVAEAQQCSPASKCTVVQPGASCVCPVAVVQDQAQAIEQLSKEIDCSGEPTFRCKPRENAQCREGKCIAD